MRNNSLKFNTRQLKYREYRLEGMTKKSSALKAGYSLTTAEHKQLDNVVDMASSLEIAGFTSRNIAETAFKRYSKDDGAIGHKYLETALKLMGAKGYSQEKAASVVNAVQVNITLPGLPDDGA